MNELYVNIFPCDIRDSRDVTEDSGIHGLNVLNGLGPESSLKGPKYQNDLGM